MKRNRLFEILAIAGLLTFYWLMSVTASLNWSNAFDEMVHLTGGYTYWRTGDYRINPQNGPLPQLWAAIPLQLMKVKMPKQDQPAWEHSNLWLFGYQFFYLSGNDADRMLFAGRAMIALLGVALGILIYAWSKELFGIAAAFLSLVLFVFCPHMLAHGSLITVDLATALFFLLSVRSLWKFLNKPAIIHFLCSSFSVAALCLSKASFVVIAPIALLLLVGRLWLGPADRFRGKILFWAGSFIGMFLTVYFLIWSCYSFRYSAFATTSPGRSERLQYSWEEIERNGGKGFLSFARHHKLLPEAFLFQSSVIFTIGNRRSFLNGQYSMIGGWWYFFPYLFLVKTALPLFLILLTAIYAALRSKQSEPMRRRLYRTMPLWIFLIVFWALAIASGMNIGHRHLIPVYPALYILAGNAASVIKDRMPAKIALFGAVVWFIAESLTIRPHYLAYFNQIIGGPAFAYRHVVDSSLDWGLDLPGLQRWLAENNTESEPVYFSYFGTARPEYYGISAIYLPGNADIQRPQDKIAPLEKGIYCVSATLLQSLYAMPVGHWNVEYEKRYSELLNQVSQSALSENAQAVDEFQRYRFARLCAYLRHRKYDAEVGYSILIFRMSDQEIQKALLGAPAELDNSNRVIGLH